MKIEQQFNFYREEVLDNDSKRVLETLFHGTVPNQHYYDWRNCHLNRPLLLWKIANEHYYNNVMQLNFNVIAALFLCFSGEQLG